MTEKIVVCRCEDVMLKDIAGAVERGFRDLESVKRYTGFGTGWCQGKSCLPMIARALVELTGETPVAPITPRPPFHPVALADLSALIPDEDGEPR